MTDTTSGYIMTRTSEALEELPFQYLKCKHPLLLPVLMIEISVEDLEEQIDECFEKLRHIEKQTGFGTEGTNYASDYQALVRDLGKMSSTFLYKQSALRKNLLRLNFFRDKLHYMDMNLPDHCKEKLSKHSISLQRRIEWITSSIEHMLLYGGIQERIQSQQTVVSSLLLALISKLYTVCLVR